MSQKIFLGPLGWTREQFEVLAMEVRQELQDPSIHALHDL